MASQLNEEDFDKIDPLARDILTSCKQGYYNIDNKQIPLTDMINNCVEKTKFYKDNYSFNIPPLKSKEKGIIEVRNESTLQTAYSYSVKSSKKNVCALNFANAFEPGGGFLYGFKYQEESLCLSSALYISITSETASEFYKYHNDNKEKFSETASDALIYSPDCPTWKIDGEVLDQPFSVSYITSAAVMKTRKHTSEQIKEIHDVRIRAIINCAIENGVKNLVLGAFGCGAFGNDPNDIAQSFKTYLVDEEKRFYFESISFSIIGNDTTNFDVFSQVFKQRSCNII